MEVSPLGLSFCLYKVRLLHEMFLLFCPFLISCPVASALGGL